MLATVGPGRGQGFLGGESGQANCRQSKAKVAGGAVAYAHSKGEPIAALAGAEAAPDSPGLGRSKVGAGAQARAPARRRG